MKIENYDRKFEQAKATGEVIHSDPHWIYCFKMRLLIYLNGNIDAKGTHMSVSFQLMKGELDDFIKWPFNKLITFVLIHQDDKNKCFSSTSSAALKNNRFSREFFKQPVTDKNKPHECKWFIALTKLHADGFIKNDTIYIRCVIE